MSIISIATNGDHVLVNRSALVYAASAFSDIAQVAVLVESNPDSATLTWGYRKESDGLFKAFPTPDFDTSEGCVVGYGPGCTVMVRVAGIVNNPVVINVRP